MKHANYKNILKGVSTLDVMKKNLKANLLLIISLLVILTTFSANAFGGHSTLDLVDPSFNPQVQTTNYGFKWVSAVHVLPDGKFLVLGTFNAYNGVPVGKLVRLNADGSLDTTFNNQAVTAISPQSRGTIIIQPDGKIVLSSLGLVVGNQSPRALLRLNPDGTLDSTFDFSQTLFIHRIFRDSLGRFLMLGNFTTPNGARRIIRINPDGSLDSSFDFPLADTSLREMMLQGDKPIVHTNISNVSRIFRLNEDGSEDASFTPFTGPPLSLQGVQPGNKIIYLLNSNLLRLNENGGSDATFQPVDISGYTGGLDIKFTGDGKLVTMAYGTSRTFKRFLPDGAVDPSFTPYTNVRIVTYTILPDDSIVIGDGDFGIQDGGNDFIKLTPGGTVDPTFNTGIGFRNVLPGIIESIETYPDGKTLLGGRFDVINGVTRYRLARLNADSSVDTSFEINRTMGSGNYFSIIHDINQTRRQADGKIVVSGLFDYVLNGETKKNFVRLNSDGSIDPTFNLTINISDLSQPSFAGQNRFKILSDGSLMIATSKVSSAGASGPIKLTPTGALDTSFNSALKTASSIVHIHDLEIQPDGKILVSGTHELSLGTGFNAFVVRLNTGGSVDSSFSYPEETGRQKSRLALLPDGKILHTKNLHPNAGSAKIQRLNSNGSVDNTFNTVTLSDTTASLNALLVLPNGKIFVGGKFTQTVNGQTAKNLLQLDANGSFEPTVYNINEEVLCLAVDAEGRVLIGGGFTFIDTSGGGSGAIRSFVARLTDSGAPFDFDGDGRTDIGVWRASSGSWWYLNSSDLSGHGFSFGTSSDIITPGDYTGDGKTDLGVFRPSTAEWFIQRSEDGSYTAVPFGLPGDIPAPADYDGDGKTDLAVFRPSNQTWFIQLTGGGFGILTFGLDGDRPVPADYDGDGKADIAVWRPSNGTWWIVHSSDLSQHGYGFGLGTDRPVVGDYTGDGKADIAVWRNETREWLFLRSEDGTYYSYPSGLPGDIPAPGDYDGDGRFDSAVFRPSTQTWYIDGSTAGSMIATFGLDGDRPVPSSFVP